MEPPLPRARRGLVAWLCGSRAGAPAAAEGGEAVAAGPAPAQAAAPVAAA